MSLSLPSVGSFASREDLINHVKTHAFNHGYAVSTKRSEKDKFVYLKCDRGSHYNNRLNLIDETRQRNTSTRLIDCPFELYGKKMEDGQWHLTIKNANHNHEASEDISGHPSSHHLNKDDQKRVQEMFIAGIYPYEILSTFCQSNPDSLVISKTIYNARDKVRRDNLQGRTPIQALLDKLIEGNFEYDYQYDQSGNLTHLFFAHPKSIVLTKTYNSVLLINCTYKTNKFKMPLLYVVGMTNFNITFSSCFAFLKSEQKEDYNWALTRVAYIFDDISKFQVIVTDRELALMHAIRTIFPESHNLLCIWHIEKNMLINCRRHFSTKGEWSIFLESNLTTLKVEGAHAALKRYLQVSVGNLHAIHEKISLALENRYQEIKTMISQEMIQIPQAQNKSFYAQVVTKVSTFALKKVHEQFLKASSVTPENPLQPCSDAFKSSMGCSVEVKNHPQLLTKRDLSTFELVMEKQRKCGLCHGTGHNSRMCPNAESESSKSSQRKCGLCHEIGHNSRTCPNAESESSDSS
ncbi:17336_t:CDS:2 [Cetraspora pellucida]|uniref:17336_t:CDS:1 n=1 Tax=Cetraspora pellucida TaxID=1433469 RepID=A0A9N9I419_9GLOM|nr:17336_t:CDS:2 [Cetraspora pellucida]